MTHNRKQILTLLDEHGLNPSRALGQNFVSDANTVRRIARLAGVGKGDHVIEIGAGLGSLTLALAETGADVVAVEVDRHVLPVLQEVVAGTGVRVVEGDALKLDLCSLLPADSTATLVANLPYNVGTAIVARVLEEVPQITKLLVMVQKEVGQRLVAGVGDDAYGALSVKISYYCEARLAGTVPPTVFVPQPDVDSALVELVRRERPLVDPSSVSPEALFPLVRAGFSQRRKMLRRALSGIVGPEEFECAGIAPTARAEELDVIAWGRLAACQTESMTQSNTPMQS